MCILHCENPASIPHTSTTMQQEARTTSHSQSLQTSWLQPYTEIKFAPGYYKYPQNYMKINGFNCWCVNRSPDAADTLVSSSPLVHGVTL